MRSSRAVALAALMMACGSTTSSSSSSNNNSNNSTTPSSATVDGDNVLQITVNGDLCNSDTSSDYLNKPCVSVTICEPGTSTCQTVNDILLDTGSFGLRVFSSALSSLSLSPVSTSSGSLYECAFFGDGSVFWGPVVSADVILGNEAAVTIPIQLAGSSVTVTSSGFGGGSSTPCDYPGFSVDATPSEAGMNGILGIGPVAYDCGDDCTSAAENGANNGNYYTCTTSSSRTTCSGTAVELASQVVNPVAMLSTDNNGVIVQLPEIGESGAASATGNLILGIDTRSNNASSGETPFVLSEGTSYVATVTVGSSYEGYFDTGTNAFTLPGSSSWLCADDSGWYCPSSTQSLSVKISDVNSTSGTVSFDIADIDTLYYSSANMVYDNIGAESTEYGFGLPFHFGKTVYVGLTGTSSNLGTGPYVAF